MKTYEGKVELNPNGNYYGLSTGFRIGSDDWVDGIFTDLEGKNVKVTIEVLPETY